MTSQNVDLVACKTHIEQWREKLLDLSMRNKLLNFRRDTNGVMSLDIPDVIKFAEILATPEQGFSIYPNIEDDSDGYVVAKSNIINETNLDNEVIHCHLSVQKFKKNALTIERASRTALEEGGSNILYVAIGFLKWYESDLVRFQN